MRARNIGIFLLFVILGIALWIESSAVKFNADFINTFPSTIAYLFLISLFVERAIEVFLSAWRSEDADKKDLEIKHLNERISAILEEDEKKELCNSLKEKEKDRMLYSAKSRIYAIWAGIIFGALISLVGIRILNDLVINLDSLGDSQKILFTCIDILLTAVVLAGGSEAINKIMKLYGSFIQSTSEKFK